MNIGKFLRTAFFYRKPPVAAFDDMVINLHRKGGMSENCRQVLKVYEISPFSAILLTRNLKKICHFSGYASEISLQEPFVLIIQLTNGNILRR